jgi:hypothetical protein
MNWIDWIKILAPIIPLMTAFFVGALHLRDRLLKLEVLFTNHLKHHEEHEKIVSVFLDVLTKKLS